MKDIRQCVHIKARFANMLLYRVQRFFQKNCCAETKDSTGAVFASSVTDSMEGCWEPPPSGPTSRSSKVQPTLDALSVDRA